MKTIKFPQDESVHDSITEWWYFNGHLKDAKGHQYSFMDCFFKADVKKADIAILKHTPLKIIYFSHSVLSDIKAKKIYPIIDYISKISKDTFSRPLVFINYKNNFILKGKTERAIEKISESKYHIKTDNLDLTMTSMKKPLLENETGYVKLKEKGTYYYTLTNLKTEGTIKINGKNIKVKGKSWMDHQWADVIYNPKTRWTWFSIQLDSNIELVCFEYLDGNFKKYIATISYEDGRQASADDMVLTPTGIAWQSPVTKTRYPLSWKIDIPSKNISIEVKPLFKNQEMLFGQINYWEGALTIKGTIDDKKVKGVGFLELAGYQKGISNMNLWKYIIKKAIAKQIKSSR